MLGKSHWNKSQNLSGKSHKASIKFTMFDTNEFHLCPENLTSERNIVFIIFENVTNKNQDFVGNYCTRGMHNKFCCNNLS